MKFAYAGFISPAAETGEEVIIFRPEVPLRIHGANGSATYMALVDTGADNTMLPLSIAHELSIATYKAEGPNATAFGGQQIPLAYADVELELRENDASIRWKARVHFFDLADSEPETIVVGHQGFLDFFTAVFDGEQLTLDLEPNQEMPQIGARP
jgi:predicted aspartyl protease